MASFEDIKTDAVVVALIAVGVALLCSGLVFYPHRKQALIVKLIARDKSGTDRILSCADSPLQSAIILDVTYHCTTTSNQVQKLLESAGHSFLEAAAS